MSVIEVTKLNKAYEDKTIFHDFSMTVEEGEMLAICGESGCGKTTLLNIIGLLEPFDSGDVIVKGQKNVKPNSREATKLLRETISYLFQNFALVEDETVKYNLMLALHYVEASGQEKADRIHQALSAVGLEGYEDKRIYHLSGGEQQRVAIARCLLKPSNIVLADEPTGSVDPHNREIIINLIKEMNINGKTVVIVTHDPYVAAHCRRQIYLES
ncbi:MAG: ABC transporter ATP-binding protein [Eubacteriales bacterium]|nr:ABC transporter ATP-binding protein [Eubacteriales bacterium]